MMLEWHWFANHDPEPMLRFLGSQPVGNESNRDRRLGRKLRRFILGCCHRVKHLTGRDVQAAIAVFERDLEDVVPDDEFRTASTVVVTAGRHTHDSPGGEHPATCAVSRACIIGPLTEIVVRAITAAKEAQTAAAMAAEGKRHRVGDPTTAVFRAIGSAERAYQISLLHDIFGNPFRPVAFDPSWRTSDVLALATGSYDERAFDRLPILADALQDAGCDSDDLLNHLRSPDAAHVRGCWALDLVLGKE